MSQDLLVEMAYSERENQILQKAQFEFFPTANE